VTASVFKSAIRCVHCSLLTCTWEHGNVNVSNVLSSSHRNSSQGSWLSCPYQSQISAVHCTLLCFHILGSPGSLHTDPCHWSQRRNTEGRHGVIESSGTHNPSQALDTSAPTDAGNIDASSPSADRYQDGHVAARAPGHPINSYRSIRSRSASDAASRMMLKPCVSSDFCHAWTIIWVVCDHPLNQTLGAAGHVPAHRQPTPITCTMAAGAGRVCKQSFAGSGEVAQRPCRAWCRRNATCPAGEPHAAPVR
jgi:hypothetical protein